MIDDGAHTRLGIRALDSASRVAQAVLDASRDPAFLIDTDGVVLSCNNILAKRLDVPRAADVVGRNILDFFAPDVAAARNRRIQEVIQTAEPVEFEDVRNGRMFQHRLVPILNDAGAVEAIVFIANDVTAHRQAEQTLVKNQRRFWEILQKVPVGIAIADSFTGKILQVNQTYCDIVGRSEEELLKLDFLAITHPDDLQADLDLMARLRRGEIRSFHIEKRYCRKDGSLIWGGLTVTPMWEPGEAPSCHLALVKDITERKLSEAALRQSETRANALLDAIPDLIFRLNREGVLLDFRGRKEDLYVQSGNPVGRKIGSDLPPDFAKRIEQRIAATLDTGTTQVFEYQLDIPGKGIRDYEARFVASGVEEVTAILRDITERKLADAALRESRDRFRQFFESQAQYCYMVSADGRIIDLNPAALNALGYTRDQLIGSPLKEIYAPECAARTEELFRRWLATGRLHNEEQTIITKTGERRAVLLSASAVRNADGKILHSTSTHIDITDRKRAEEERDKLQSQLLQSQKIESIGRLAGGIAHDFNNILTAMLMHVSFLQQNPACNEETREILKELEVGVTRAASLTTQLLMFSRRSVLDMRAVDLNEVVENLLKMLRRLIPENVLVRFQPQPALPAISADAGLVQQVLVNLCVNARDAMPDGGVLSIATTVVEKLETAAGHHPDAARAGLFVRLSVADTGCGMDDTVLKQIFEPFFTTKELGKGTGLGLATVYGIVTQHKGWVEVESELGKGSTFYVFLPVAADRVRAPVESPGLSAGGGGETILLVEDELMVRRMVGQCLRTLGYRVLEAGNGREAMELWHNHADEIELLFTDIVMPEGSNGLELAQRLRETKPRLKVVISSGYSTDATHAGFQTQPGMAYLAKPYLPSVLRAAVRQCLDQKPASSGA